jgi:hypothetical protein
MREFLIGLALSVMAASAQAQWVLVAEGKNGDNFYADPTTKRRTGNVVRIWEMQDYLKPEISSGKLSYSTVVYREYDCVNKMFQTLQGTEFAGQMATGESLGTHTRPANKGFVPPGTVANIIFNFACN